MNDKYQNHSEFAIRKMNLKLIEDKKYRNHSEFVVDIMNLQRILDKDGDIMIKKRIEVDSYSNWFNR